MFIEWPVIRSTFFPGADKTVHYGVLFLQEPGQKDMISPIASFFTYFSDIQTSLWFIPIKLYLGLGL